MRNSLDSEFSTKDLDLASYLYASGVLLRALDRGDPLNIVFVFDKPEDELLRAFAMSTATVNVNAYNNARKHLLKRLKERY